MRLWSVYCQLQAYKGLPPHSGLSAPFITALFAFLSRSSGSKEKLKVCNMACSVAFLTASLGQVNDCFIRVFDHL